MVMEAALIISWNLSNSDTRRERRTLKMCHGCVMEGLRKTPSGINVSITGYSMSLKKPQLSFIKYLESPQGARHTVGCSWVRKVTKQGPCTRGDLCSQCEKENEIRAQAGAELWGSSELEVTWKACWDGLSVETWMKWAASKRSFRKWVTTQSCLCSKTDTVPKKVKNR